MGNATPHLNNRGNIVLTTRMSMLTVCTRAPHLKHGLAKIYLGDPQYEYRI